jgi:hypothetical protein
VFWPYSYGDVLTFALWPYVYNNPFWDYDVDALLDIILSTGLYVADTHGDDVYGVDVCGALAPGVPQLPVDRIEQTVRPIRTQIASLDGLKSASLRASEFVATSCPSEIPQTPLGRLDMVERRIAAMMETVQILRTPLAEFYNSLTDEQRRRLDPLPTSNFCRSDRSARIGRNRQGGDLMPSAWRNRSGNNAGHLAIDPAQPTTTACVRFREICIV